MNKRHYRVTMLKVLRVIFIFISCLIHPHLAEDVLRTFPLSSYFGPSSSIYDVPFGLYNFQLPSNEYKNNLLVPNIKTFGQSSNQEPSVFKNSDDFSPINNEYTAGDKPVKYTIFPNPIYQRLVNDLVTGTSKFVTDSVIRIPREKNVDTYEQLYNRNAKQLTLPYSQNQYYDPLSKLTSYSNIYPIYQPEYSDVQSQSNDLYKSSSNPELPNSNSEISKMEQTTNFNPCSSAKYPNTVLYYYKDPCYDTNNANTLNSPSSNDVENTPLSNLPSVPDTTNSMSDISQNKPTENLLKSRNLDIQNSEEVSYPRYVPPQPPQSSKILSDSKVNQDFKPISYEAHNLISENIIPSGLGTNNIQPYPTFNSCRCSQSPSYNDLKTLPQLLKYFPLTDYLPNNNHFAVNSNPANYNNIRSPQSSNYLNRSARDSQIFSPSKNSNKFSSGFNSEVSQDNLDATYKQRGMFMANYPGYQNYNHNYGFNKQFPVSGNSYPATNYNNGYGMNQYGYNAMYGLRNPIRYGSYRY